MRLMRATTALLLGGLVAAGCVGGIGGDEKGTQPTLTPETEPSVTPLMKLSTRQYQNTVIDLLAASGLSSIAPTVQPLIDSVPADATDTFKGLDNRVASEHMNGFFNVAAAVGDAIETDPALLTAVAGDCASEATLSDSCVEGFLDTFARRAFRRDLKVDERARYAELNDGVRPPAEAIRAMVISLMLAPQFLNHVEIEGVLFAGESDVYQLTGYEVAAKLAYAFWQSMPDDELLDAARDGSLDSDEGYAAQVERVFTDPRTKDTLWSFWDEWLRLSRFPGFAHTRPAFQTLAEGENLGAPGSDHYADMVAEIRALTDLFTWDESGTVEQLLTTNLSVTESTDLAHLYGVEPYSGSGAHPTFADGERAGLLQRAALLVNALEVTNPFHRGAFTRRFILCDALPQPDPAELPDGSLDPPPPDPTATTRERYEAKVKDNPLCEGCHGGFSDLGYVMESFDALGRFRTMELVIDEQTGEVLGELPVDDVAVARVELQDDTPVEGVADLNQRIVASRKVNACIAQQYFTYALRREPGDASGDEALTADLAEADLALAEIFKNLALHPSFRARKVGN
jgi:Protein of unknown function (DUF1592)/Protein of unknown function (DUF1588)/Protein of unknown function (DUF1595)/Protein of unknown function (DUF1585)